MTRTWLGRALIAVPAAAALAGAGVLWWRWGEAVVLSQPLWLCAPH